MNEINLVISEYVKRAIIIGIKKNSNSNNDNDSVFASLYGLYAKDYYSVTAFCTSVFVHVLNLQWIYKHGTA